MPTHETVAAAATTKTSAQVGLIKKVLHCVTRSKTILPLLWIVCEYLGLYLSRQRHYIRTVHRNDKRTVFALHVWHAKMPVDIIQSFNAGHCGAELYCYHTHP